MPARYSTSKTMMTKGLTGYGWLCRRFYIDGGFETNELHGAKSVSADYRRSIIEGKFVTTFTTSRKFSHS
jgi:hypothetical protein